MTYRYEFFKRDSYTSYQGLSAEAAQAIEDSNYDNFPGSLEGEDVRVDNILEEYSYSPTTRAGYAVLAGGGIRVKIETIYMSPDYRKVNGHGEHKQKMTILSDVPLTFKNCGR